MMANTAYFNGSLDRVPSGGGAVRVTLASSVGRGNGGTSLPCKRVCLITDGVDVRVNIGVAASAILGLPVPYWSATIPPAALEIEIDDVAKLYFYGTDNKVIDILYRT